MWKIGLRDHGHDLPKVGISELCRDLNSDLPHLTFYALEDHTRTKSLHLDKLLQEINPTETRSVMVHPQSKPLSQPYQDPKT